MKMKYVKPVTEVIKVRMDCPLMKNSGSQSNDADSKGLFFFDEEDDKDVGNQVKNNAWE